MKDITPVEEKLGLVDVDAVLGEISEGTSLTDIAQRYNVPRHRLFKYLTATDEAATKYNLAVKAGEDLDREVVIRSLRSIANTYASDMFDEDGVLKPVSEWPKELVAAFEIEEVYGREGKRIEQTGVVKKVKTIDRLRALEMLGKERGMFSNKVQGNVTLTLEQLVAESFKGETIDVRPEA